MTQTSTEPTANGRGVPRLYPVIEPMEIRRANVFEHTPLDYYRYGQYPRWIRPVGASQPRTITQPPKEQP